MIAAGGWAEAARRAEAAVATVIEEQSFVGAALSLLRGKDVCGRLAFGHAHVESERPMTVSTVSDIGSVTKAFTATLLMLLRDEGLLALDDPVEAYWPGFAAVSKLTSDRPITLRQLATHTSGIAFRQIFHPEEPPPRDVEELIDQLGERGLVFPPGAGHKYSNAAFEILAQVIAAATDLSFEECLRQRLLEPLGMSDTTFEQEGLAAERRAFGYQVGRDLRGIPMQAEAQHTRGAGGLLSTVDDLAKFVTFQLGAGPAIMSPTTLRELHTPAYVEPGWAWAQAIGWHVEPRSGRTWISHGGTAAHYVDGMPGQWRAHIVLVPDIDVGVAALTNCNRDPAALCTAAVDAVASAAETLKRQELHAAARQFSWCAGTYQLVDQELVSLQAAVDVAGGGLDARITGGITETWHLAPIDQSSLRVTTGLLAGEVASFERDREGSSASRFRIGRLLFTRDENPDPPDRS